MDLFSLELDAGSPLILSMPEFEALELIWGKSPVEEPLRGPPVSIITSQPTVQLLPPTEEKDVLMGDDEMAAWLHIPIDMTDARADLNRQTEAVSSNSVPSTLGEKAEEVDYQRLEPVLPENDTKSDSQVGPLETNIVCTEKACASGLGRGNNNGKDKSGFDGHNKLTKENSLVGSKFSTINSNEKRKEALHRVMSSGTLRIIKNHNLSEQRRRGRINERMKTLQELVPRSAKMLSMGGPMTPLMYPTRAPYIQPMPMASMGMGMNQDVAVSMNIAAMVMQPVMQPFGPANPYPHINQPIQAPLLQMPHQKMAPEMFPYSHIGHPYHFPHVVPGQASPQYGTAKKKMKGKQAESSNGSSA